MKLHCLAAASLMLVGAAVAEEVSLCYLCIRCVIFFFLSSIDSSSTYILISYAHIAHIFCNKPIIFNQPNLRGVADVLEHGTNDFNFEEQVTQFMANLPRQPIRNYNPMCIGIIGGVGPQAGADVFNKVVDVASHKNWYYQARDAPAVYVSSSPELDGTTQNDWVWADQDTVVANVGKVLNKITDEFPSCVRDYGVIGLACNTIHE